MTDDPPARPPADETTRSAPEQERLLLAECLRVFEDDGRDAVEALLAKHADSATIVRARLEALLATGLVESDGAVAETELPRRLGPFRLLARIGRGGMGIVHLAEQDALERRVAVKVLRPEEAYVPGALDRFRREVLTAAKLVHPAIVPVHDAGEHDGVPYLVMQYVRGVNLAEVIDALGSRAASSLTGDDLRRTVGELVDAETRRLGEQLGEPDPESGSASDSRATFAGSWVDTCCRLIARVADGLHHAHQHGVLHRDVKPSNVMITPNGDGLLLDFGLAQDEGSDRLTRSGAVLGSVPYMAPEQLRGQHTAIDRRTDVYGLGVTLCELLSLRPPFGRDERTRARILTGDVEPLGALPKVVRTICTTAIDPDRNRRYATCGEFAEDLRCHLEMRPIHARPIGRWRGLRRRARRHPVWTTALVLTSLGAVVGPTTFALYERSVSETLRLAYDEAERERLRAEDHLVHAYDSIDRTLAIARDERLRDRPRLDGLRRRLMTVALEVYERLHDYEARAVEGQAAAAAAADPRLRDRVRGARLEVGRIHAELGRPEDAVTQLEQSIEAIDTALAEAPNDTALQVDRVEATHELGVVTRDLGDSRRAATLFEEAIAFGSRCLQASSEAPLQRAVAETLETLGAMTTNTNPRAALDCYRRAAPLWATLLETDRSPQMLSSAAAVQSGLGFAAARIGEHDTADLAFDTGVELFLEATAAAPESVLFRANLAQARYIRGRSDLERGRSDRARSNLELAVAALRDLVRDHPERIRYRKQLQNSFANLGSAALQAGALGDAAAAIQGSIDVADDLAEREPERVEHRMAAAQARAKLAIVEDRRGEVDRAAELWEHACGELREIATSAPARPEFGAALGFSLYNRANFVRRHGDAEAVLAILDEAERALAGPLEHAPSRNARGLHERVLHLRAQALIDTGNPGEAVRVLREIVAAGYDTFPVDGPPYREALGERADYLELLR